MALGPRSVWIGPRLGVGLGGSGGGIPGVTRDPSNLNYYPASGAEWTLLMAAAGIGTGNPSSLWLAQESSGSLADSIGSVTLSGTGTAPSYRQAITGTARLGVRWADNLASSTLENTTTAPNASTTSTLMLGYLDLGTTPAQRAIWSTSAGVSRTLLFAGSQALRIFTGTNSNGAVAISSTHGWFALRSNLTASSVTAFWEREKITGVFSAPTSGTYVGIGAIPTIPANTGNISYAYLCQFTGAAAELTDAQVKTLLQTLGASIPWT